jgi:hypothetical protein
MSKGRPRKLLPQLLLVVKYKLLTSTFSNSLGPGSVPENIRAAPYEHDPSTMHIHWQPPTKQNRPITVSDTNIEFSI